ncbi:MAG: hypothetical protein ABSA02_43605 [Trebonia sp.]
MSQTNADLENLVDTDLDTLATALYVKIDDELKTNPDLWIARPEVGIAPKLSDAELVTMSVLQALLGFTSDSESRFLRHARTHLRSFFLCAGPVGLQEAAAQVPGSAERPDSGPGPRHRHLRRRHLGHRLDPGRVRAIDRPPNEATWSVRRSWLLRSGARFLKPLRQLIESVNDTWKGQIDLEAHGGHAPAGAVTRVLQRLLALTSAIWQNHHCGVSVAFPRRLGPRVTPWN